MNQKAYYGEFGGQYVAESLMNTLEELDKAFEEAIHDPEFMEQYHYYLKQYVGRETPLYFAERLSEKYGTKIYLKREDLRSSLQSVWEKRKLLRRPVPDSTAWQLRQVQLCLTWNVPFTWARKISGDRH